MVTENIPSPPSPTNATFPKLSSSNSLCGVHHQSASSFKRCLMHATSKTHMVDVSVTKVNSALKFVFPSKNANDCFWPRRDIHYCPNANLIKAPPRACCSHYFSLGQALQEESTDGNSAPRPLPVQRTGGQVTSHGIRVALETPQKSDASNPHKTARARLHSPRV